MIHEGPDELRSKFLCLCCSSRLSASLSTVCQIGRVTKTNFTRTLGLSVCSALSAVSRVTNNHRLECAKILVPACLYVAQNNLLLVAADNLEGPVLALFGQMKILSTAIFSVIILRRTLGCRRWLSLCILTGSIAVVQISQMQLSISGSEGGDEGSKNMPLGLAVSALVSGISGFSGVYFELVLKGSPISVWVRNIHLALFSIVAGAAAVYSNDLDAIRKCGFFAGYGQVVFTYVAVQAAGGLLIAAVIKYADNILKAFATSISIVVISIVSSVFYSFQPSLLFFAGTIGVVYAVFLYGNLFKGIAMSGQSSETSLQFHPPSTDSYEQAGST